MMPDTAEIRKHLTMLLTPVWAGDADPKSRALAEIINSVGALCDALDAARAAAAGDSATTPAPTDLVRALGDAILRAFCARTELRDGSAYDIATAAIERLPELARERLRFVADWPSAARVGPTREEIVQVGKLVVSVWPNGVWFVEGPNGLKVCSGPLPEGPGDPRDRGRKAARDYVLALTGATLEPVDQLRRERAEALARLPEGMKHCTIRFRECGKGHGRLVADNWVDNGCEWCKLADAKSKLDEANANSACLGCGKLTQGRAGLVNSGFYAPSCGSGTCNTRIEAIAREARSRLVESEVEDVNAAWRSATGAENPAAFRRHFATGLLHATGKAIAAPLDAPGDPLVLSRALGDAAFQAGEVVVEVKLKHTWLQYAMWGAIGGSSGVVSMRRWDGDRWATEPVVWLTSSTLTAHARFVKYGEAAMAPTARGEIP